MEYVHISMYNRSVYHVRRSDSVSKHMLSAGLPARNLLRLQPHERLHKIHMFTEHMNNTVDHQAAASKFSHNPCEASTVVWTSKPRDAEVAACLKAAAFL